MSWTFIQRSHLPHQMQDVENREAQGMLQNDSSQRLLLCLSSWKVLLRPNAGTRDSRNEPACQLFRAFEVFMGARGVATGKLIPVTV